MSKPLAAKGVGACDRACSQHPAFAGFASKAEQAAWSRYRSSPNRRQGWSGRVAASRRDAAARRDDPLVVAGQDPAAGDDMVAGLYRTHRASLTRFIRRQVSSERAPDLLHNLFARFLGLAPDQRAAIMSTEAYLKRAARNLVRDDHKASQRHAAGLHISDEHVVLTAPCQIAALEARDMLNRIEQTIQKLKPITREIFLAHRLDGYSYAEIAQRTGLSVKGVEKHMSRAIAHIDRSLSPR